jgi:flagellar basal body rod protein FlgG
VARTTALNLHNGGLVQTGRPLDVAIPDDKGFFVVSTPGGERYTRAGSFRLDVNGTLRTPEGHPVLGENQRPIQVDPNATNVSIDRDASVITNGVPTGKLALVTFKNLAGIEKEGHILLRARPEAGPAIKHAARLESGSLELSNASAVQEMTSLVNASRQFEMTARVIEAFSAADHRAATDIMGNR